MCRQSEQNSALQVRTYFVFTSTVVGHICLKGIFGLLRVVRRLEIAEEEWQVAGEPAALTGHCIQLGIQMHATQQQRKNVVLCETQDCTITVTSV